MSIIDDLIKRNKIKSALYSDDIVHKRIRNRQERFRFSN